MQTIRRRIAVIGDIGGHLPALRQAIIQLDGDPDHGSLPKDLTVIQVGDLVRFSPDQLFQSDACVVLANHMLNRNPDRWIQLWGNHEAAALGGARRPIWVEDNPLQQHTLDTLKRWWRNRNALLAAGVEDDAGNCWLVTHAGLTLGRWRTLGEPRFPDAVASLNELAESSLANAFKPGFLVTHKIAAAPSVVWSEVNREFYLPWMERGRAPFGQIHGHASPWNWSKSAWKRSTPRVVRSTCQVDHQNRRTVTMLGHNPTQNQPALAIGVDWGLGASPPSAIWPVLTLQNSILLT